MSVAYVVDDVFAEHVPPSSHPERPERIVAVRDALRDAGLPDRGDRLPTREATESEIGRVHSAGYLADLTREVPGKSGWLDGDTYYSPRTWAAAVAAAGAVIDVTRAVLDGRARRGLAVVRPPGHHAEADRAMGFCLLNNAAIAAADAREAGAARVAVLDWDVHHGNGTQHVFEDDPAIMYLSCHQYPFYPGTGACDEVGVGPGMGATVNVGLPGGCGDPEYLAVFDRVFVPELTRFRPDVIIISAGFDAHVSDPLASMRVTRAGYRAMASRLVAVADDVCQGRIVCALEGGYDLEGLSGGVVAVLDAFDRGTGSPQPAAESVEPAANGSMGGPEIAAGARAAIAKTRSALAACRPGEAREDRP